MYSKLGHYKNKQSGASVCTLDDALSFNQEQRHFTKEDYKVVSEAILKPGLSYSWFRENGLMKLKPDEQGSQTIRDKLETAFNTAEKLREEEPIKSLLEREGKPAKPEDADVSGSQYYLKRILRFY